MACPAWCKPALNKRKRKQRSARMEPRAASRQGKESSGSCSQRPTPLAQGADYLDRAVKAFREWGQAISDDFPAHLSPLGWAHFILTGHHVWKPRDGLDHRLDDARFFALWKLRE